MDEQLVAYVSKGKVALMILAAAGFAALGVWLLLDPEQIAATSRRSLLREPVIVYALGGLLILLGAGGGLPLVAQLFRTGPVMEVDSRGILWRRWSEQVIPWSAITRSEPRRVHRATFLCLWLDQPDRYPRQAGLGRFAVKNTGMGFGDIAITMQGTDVSFERLLEVVDAQMRMHADQRVGTGSAPE